MFGSDIIRIKVKGFLKNITEDIIMNFEEKGINNKNKISYICDGIKYTINYSDNKIVMNREGMDFINTFLFTEKKSSSTYTLKDKNYTLDIDIVVDKLIISDECIYVLYTICDTGCKYEYKVEMSEYI